MSKFVRCKRCLIPTTRPDTDFVDGVCSACHSHDREKLVDWGTRKAELLELLQRVRGAGSYDCVVASSGGKDSMSIVLRLLDMGVRPLVVTASTCMLTAIGRHNIECLKRYATTIEVSLNTKVRAILNREALRLVGDISWPEHVSIFTTPFKVAHDLGIKLVFYGENPQNQYGGPAGTETANEMTRRWVSELGGFLGLRPADFIGVHGIKRRDMLDYTFPDEESIAAKGTEAHFFGYYVGPWDSHANAVRSLQSGAKYQLPTRANWWVHDKQDNAFHGIHDYFMFLKYGYGRASAQLSVDIRNGVIDRPHALKFAQKHDGLFPSTYQGVTIDQMLNQISMTRGAFIAACNDFMNREIFEDARVTWGEDLFLKE